MNTYFFLEIQYQNGGHAPGTDIYGPYASAIAAGDVVDFLLGTYLHHIGWIIKEKMFLEDLGLWAEVRNVAHCSLIN